MATIGPVATAGKLPTKIERVLAGLIDGWKTSRELEQAPYYDHCANATASDLKRLQADIEAERVEIRGYGGKPCWIARYRVRPEGLEHARSLLARMRERRGLGSR